MVKKFILSSLLAVGCTSYTLAKTTQPPSPAQLSAKVQKSLKEARKSSVAINCGGYASGVIIDEKGTILTAAHVTKKIKKDQQFKITLDDGRTFKAKALGSNLESDMGLARIVDLKGQKIPFCPVAKSAPKAGAFVFTFAHPSGLLKGRPAQVRLGRINSVSTRDKVPFSLFSDINIQPGDSGGPLFNLAGELVGIDSSAAGHIGFNIFSPIDQYHVDKKRLQKWGVWGDKNNAPMSKKRYSVDPQNQKLLKQLQTELNRRFKKKHPSTYDFVKSRVNSKGEAAIDSNSLINFMIKDAIAIQRGSKVSMGLDDPDIVSQLPKKPKHFHTLKVTDGRNVLSRAIALDKQHILAKASLLENQAKLELKLPNSSYLVTKVKTSKELDLAILKIEKAINIPLIKFPNGVVDIRPAQALVAPDFKLRPVWNIATDERRIVAKKRSLGPLKDKSIISKMRAPFPVAIRHSLPLFAKQAGTPVFDLKGNFIGVHIARFSRTMGLIIPHEKIKSFYDEFNKEQG